MRNGKKNRRCIGSTWSFTGFPEKCKERICAHMSQKAYTEFNFNNLSNYFLLGGQGILADYKPTRNLSFFPSSFEKYPSTHWPKHRVEKSSLRAQILLQGLDPRSFIRRVHTLSYIMGIEGKRKQYGGHFWSKARSQARLWYRSYPAKSRTNTKSKKIYSRIIPHYCIRKESCTTTA